MDKHFRHHGLEVLTYFRVPICDDLRNLGQIIS